MATITPILATDKVWDSRAVIEANFTNLNTDKMENPNSLTAETSLDPSNDYIPIYDASETANNKTTINDIANAMTKSGQKSITIQPPWATEDVGIFKTTSAITVTEMSAVLVWSSTPSVTWTIRHSTDRSAAGNEVVTSWTTTTSTTTGSVVTTFNDATIPTDSHVRLETTAQSWTVDSLEVTIDFTYDN